MSQKSSSKLSLLILFFVTHLLIDHAAADTSCSVDVNLNCAQPSDVAQIILGPVYWTPKSVAARRALFNSDDVQKSPSGCVGFAQLMKTECAIEFPVTAVFVTGPGRPITISFASGFYRDQSCEPGLSGAFYTYFKSPSVSGAVPPMCKSVARTGAIMNIINSLVIGQ